jgi:hypothetical protein
MTKNGLTLIKGVTSLQGCNVSAVQMLMMDLSLLGSQ